MFLDVRMGFQDYLGGLIGEFIDVMCEEKIDLFVCAVGVPPKWARIAESSLPLPPHRRPSHRRR